MRRIVFLAISFIAVLGALSALGWWYYTKGGNGKNTTTQTQPVEIPEWYKTDKDGDTIPDDTEKELGTNPNESDTDGDMISDKLEIEAYKTDPLKADTDGDGYPDGLEIIQEHDPLAKAPTNQ